MGITRIPPSVGSQTPSDLGSLSAAAFALLSCSPIWGKFWRQMLLEFGERVDMPPSPFLPLWFRVLLLSGPEWPACPTELCCLGSLHTGGPSILASGCRADPGTVGTG